MRSIKISCIVSLVVFIFAFGCGKNDGIEDTNQPVIVFSSPAFDGYIVAHDQFTVSGIAYGISGISSVHVLHNGDSSISLPGSTNWSTNISLVTGVNTLEIYCIDNNGIESEHLTRSVVLDPDAVQVTINSPANNSFTSNSMISLAGTTYVSNSTVSLVEVKVGTGAYQSASGTTTWSFNNLPLSEGTNSITVKASSDNGKTNIAMMTVVRDSVAPIISLVGPTSDLVMGVDDGSGKKFEMVVDYSDNLAGVMELVLVVKTNTNGSIIGSDSYVAVSSPQSISISIPESPGSYILQLYAIDMCSNRSPLTSPVRCTFTNSAVLSVSSKVDLVNGSTLNFDSVSIGNTVTKTIVLSNSGAGRLYISNVSSSSSDFSIDTSGLSDSCSSGDYTSFTVIFSPQSLGAKSGSITITSSSLENPSFVINCQGQGVEIGQQWVEVTFILDCSNDPLTNNVPVLRGFGGNITNSGSITNTSTMGAIFSHFSNDNQHNIMEYIGDNKYSITLKMKLPSGSTNASFLYQYVNTTPGYTAHSLNGMDYSTTSLAANNYSIPGLTVSNHSTLFGVTWAGTDVVITNYISSWLHQFSTVTTTSPLALTLYLTNVSAYNIDSSTYLKVGMVGAETWMSESGTTAFIQSDAKLPISYSPVDGGTLEFLFSVPAGSVTFYENVLVVRDMADLSLFGSGLYVGFESTSPFIFIPNEGSTATITRNFNGFL